MIRKALVLAGAVAIAFGGTAGVAAADSVAGGTATGSPGVLSGNVIQVPVHVPVNLCGNSIGLIALLNPTSGDACASS